MKNRSIGDILFDILKVLVLGIFVLLCIYPFYYVVIYSFSNAQQAAMKGVWLLPTGFSLTTYKEVLGRSDLIPAFVVSAARTVCGTTLTVLLTSLLAFLVTRKELWGRKIAYRFIVITMYLGGGLIPWYLVMKAYGFQNNFLLYIIPGAVSAYYMILIKTFIEQLPESLEESAAIEGAGFFRIFISIIMPLSKPILATVAVYTSVGQWNSWRDNFFLNSKPSLQTLQLILKRCLDSASALEMLVRQQGGAAEIGVSDMVTSKSVQMTAVVVTMTPILLVYPFAQKYFTKGIMMGAVKG